VQIEVAFDFAAFLGEEHGEEEPRAKAAAQPRQQPGPAAGAEWVWRLAMLAEQGAPDLDVSVFNLGEPLVDIALGLIGLGGRQDAVQERRVGLVLPVVLKCVQIGRRRGHA
jgi:hypothetical protein